MKLWNFFGFLDNKSSKELETIYAKMSDELSFKELAVYIAVSYIANTLSKCEFKTYEKGEEVKGELYYMLNVSPNPNQNSSQFINEFVEKLFYEGEALILPHKGHLYCADKYFLDNANPLNEYRFDNISFNTQVLPKKYKSSEVFYMKLDNKNARKLIDGLYSQYGEVIKTAINAYKKSNGKKYKYIHDQYKSGTTNFNKDYDEAIKKNLQDFLTNDNAVFQQYKNTDLVEFQSGTSKETNDIIAMRKEIFETTAHAFKIPMPMMIGNITNMNEIVKVYLSLCIDPIADMISEELTRKKYSYWEWQNGYKVVVDTSTINHVDILEVADNLFMAISSGVVNGDTLRNRLNMEELNTDFSKSYFFSKNLELAENMLNATTQEKAKALTKGGEEAV